MINNKDEHSLKSFLMIEKQGTVCPRRLDPNNVSNLQHKLDQDFLDTLQDHWGKNKYELYNVQFVERMCQKLIEKYCDTL